MKAFLFLVLIIPNLAFAGTQAECVTLASDFNRANKGRIEVGLDIQIKESPKLAVATKRGHSLTMREGAELAGVLRTCAKTDLGTRVVKLKIGESKGILCRQTNLETMAATCDDNAYPVTFRRFQ